jgi:hypothetical protein
MTTQVVPLTPVPSQTLAIVLAGQNCNISVFTLTTGLYFDLTADGVPITRTTICRNLGRLLLDRTYKPFVGDFAFVDTQGADDPEYTGLGSRWLLIYNDDPPPVPEFLP